MRSALGIGINFVLVVVLCMVTIGCGESTPVSSADPAEISGNVIVPEILCSGETAIQNNEGEFWVIEISVMNKSYEQFISDDCENWRIEAGDEIYPLGEGLMRALHYHDPTYLEKPEISKGQSGNITVCFSVPDTLEVSNATLCYQGQEPCSYVELTGGDQVESYDWNSKAVMQKSDCVNA